MPRPSRQERIPQRIWEYELPEGWRVLVGRTDRDNDRLSLRVARANDWWFHVRGMPGSHAVLVVPAGQEPDNSTVKAAAAVAAWHSKKREAKMVAVSATRARHVSKPRGAKPGTVEIRKEKVLKVRPAVPHEPRPWAGATEEE